MPPVILLLVHIRKHPHLPVLHLMVVPHDAGILGLPGKMFSNDAEDFIGKSC
jgi:hypothetical protein